MPKISFTPLPPDRLFMQTSTTNPPHQANGNIPQPEAVPFTDAERNSMRAYLQRCEVRLSTMHRIATAFISGAGLLLLIPVFFRDVIDGILILFLAQAENIFPAFPREVGIITSLVLYLLLLYPLMLSLFIPLYGVYLLVKDIVHFYFTLYMPGFPANLLNPTFSLHGVTYSPDESPRVKQAVMRYQYQNSHMNFMMAFSEGKRQAYFDDLIASTGGGILPATRQIDRMVDAGQLPPEYDATEVNRFNAAMGIARSLDRSLVEEVAVTEMALVRAVIYLRRLVLRYVKTLLMFIWTTTIAFLMLPFLNDERFPTFLILALGYTVWGLFVMRIIRQPITWIYRHREDEINGEHIDAQITLLENRVEPLHRLAVLASTVALILAVISWLQLQ